jgi:hypothetical protein
MTIKQERRGVGEEFASQAAGVVADLKPDRPIARRVAGPSVSRTDVDRVILFRALLI